MTVKEIFDLRKQGRVEEAYEAIRPIYATHKGKYTTLCMFWTASDVFKLRLDQKRFEEAEKIFLALKRMLPSVDDPDRKAAGFLQYAESRLIKESEKYRKRYFAIKRRLETNTDPKDSMDKEFSNSIILDKDNHPSNPSHLCSEEEERELSTLNSQLSPLLSRRSSTSSAPIQASRSPSSMRN